MSVSAASTAIRFAQSLNRVRSTRLPHIWPRATRGQTAHLYKFTFDSIVKPTGGTGAGGQVQMIVSPKVDSAVKGRR